MTLHDKTLVAIGLLFLQFVVIAVITRRNKSLFERFRAVEYGLAVKELGKTKPRSALLIKACYAASLIEFLVIWLSKP